MDTCTIEIKVVTQHLPNQSEPHNQKYAFAYRISIANKGNEAAQLISRHWIITDGNEARQEVKGEGVVGEQPIIKPGSVYQYTSGVVLATEVGTMSGTYHMVDESGTSFDASIPPFLLTVPHAVH